MGHYEDPRQQFEEILPFEPDPPAANYSLSQVLIRLGKTEEAKAALDRHQQVLAKKPGQQTTPAALERCKYTEARAPFKPDQPDKAGIKVTFADATQTAFGSAANNFHGPVGLLDINHRGHNDLFVVEGIDGFRVLTNANGVFQPLGERLPGVAGGGYGACLVGDLNNDRYEDVLVLGEKASHVFKFATNGVAREITPATGLKNLTATKGLLADLDFSGKLGLLAVTPITNSVRVFRNLGNSYFSETTKTSGVPATVTGVRQVSLDDWNGDDLLDLFVTRDGQPPLLLPKQRGGPLTPTNSPANWPAGSVISVGDLNNDFRNDLVVATAEAIEVIVSGAPDKTRLPTGGWAARSLHLVDYDNDGWLDIVATGNGLRAWRNLGPAGFKETTQPAGLDRAAIGEVEHFAAADFDNDGDTDFLLSVKSGGLRLLRNDGGNANQLVKLRLLGNRSNASGLGIRLELTAGGLRILRTVTSLPVEIGVGQHQQLDSLTVHWFDLALNSVDVKVDPRTPLALLELEFPTGSCPYLYAWDGQRFRFVTDILGASPAGLPAAEGRYIDADTEEFVWLGDEQMFQPRDRHYVVQITEELREVLYLDTAKLVAVDHPAGTEVHPTSKLRPGKPFPPHELVALGARKPLRQATQFASGESAVSGGPDCDVTGRLAEIDGQVVSPLKLRAPQLRGLAEPYGLLLDFGPLQTERPLVLALTGWLRFGGGMANIAASHDPALPFPFPTLEVETAGGVWKPVDGGGRAPAGKTKTILVDLTGKLPADSRRLRLTTAFEIHWDRVALFERAAQADTRTVSLLPCRTDLHWRGFSQFEDLPWYVPLTPNYEKVRQHANWLLNVSGWCTRYGPVDELLAKRDDALVLLNAGDELTLAFAADQLPPKSPGAVRDFFLYSDGWDKDADFHVARGTTVEPIPFHGMDDQRYGQQARPATDGDTWIQKYNTRWVGPLTVSRIK